MSTEQLVHVALGADSYDIHIGTNLPHGALIAQAMSGKTRKVLIVTNETIAPLYLQQFKADLEAQGLTCGECILPDGEEYKNVDSYMQIMTAAIEQQLDRGCALIALGGGVIGDLTGFAAATYQRGIAFFQVPTTLLSMVDSSVGGKTAINHPQGKNMIGAFYQPQAVLIDLTFLKTLPERQIAAGMAEVIKYGAILDRAFFDYLASKAGYSALDLAYVIKRCCELKAEVVAQDEKEHGLRALLNFGHTFGHAIEVGLGFGNFLHGEAVAIGMAIAAWISVESKFGLTEPERDALVEVIKRYDLPYQIPDTLTGDDFVAHMLHDKKVKAGRISYIMLQALGRAAVTRAYDNAQIASLLKACPYRTHYDQH